MSVTIHIDQDAGDLVTAYGLIEHGNPRPDRGEVGHLMIVTTDYVRQILAEGGSIPTAQGALHSVTVDGDRIFAHLDYWGKRWTWELFEAHFDDGKGPDILLGRWPD